MLITGLRGVGKTVLLGQFRKKALSSQWVPTPRVAQKTTAEAAATLSESTPPDIGMRTTRSHWAIVRLRLESLLVGTCNSAFSVVKASS